MPPRTVEHTMDYRSCISTVRALADGEETFLAALERAPAFDPQVFAAFLERHRLVAWVAPVLGSERVRRALPAAFLREAGERAPARRQRTERLLADCLQMRAAFAQDGLDCLLLKGLVFGQRFYGDISRRHQQDVDILVRSAELPAALATLERLGYAKDEGRIGEGAVRRSLSRGDSEVDVHWNLRRRARRRIDEETLWASRARLQLGGQVFETLGDEHALLFLLLAMCGDLRRGACPVRCFLDLYLLLRHAARTQGRELDWEAFLARRQAEALHKPCVNVLALFLAVWPVAAEFPG
ncbi:MAG TPA: nucleotidyltransferase family protein, partial [Planctomycetota bacterium]|nr:nucleotidyltransferase family protein [Planctomycetota bacterium]